MEREQKEKEWAGNMGSQQNIFGNSYRGLQCGADAKIRRIKVSPTTAVAESAFVSVGENLQISSPIWGSVPKAGQSIASQTTKETTNREIAAGRLQSSNEQILARGSGATASFIQIVWIRVVVIVAFWFGEW
jgi:hypothetical protein